MLSESRRFRADQIRGLENAKHSDPSNLAPWLYACRQRPRKSRTADSANEFPPPHVGHLVGPDESCNEDISSQRMRWREILRRENR